MSFNTNTFSLERLILSSLAMCWVIQGSPRTFLFLSTTHRLILWRQNQNSCSTMMVEGNFFFISLYVRVEVPCLPIPNLALHKVYVFTCIAQNRFRELVGTGNLGSRVVDLQHRCAMCHIMLCKIKRTLCILRNGVVNFAGMMWIAFGSKWHAEILFGGTKQQWAL